MTMITPSYLGETIEYSSLHACRSTLEDPTAMSILESGGSSGNSAILRPRRVNRPADNELIEQLCSELARSKPGQALELNRTPHNPLKFSISALALSPSSSSAPSAYKFSSAVTSVCTGGGSMKSKPSRSLMPIALSVSTVLPRFVR